MVSTDTKTEALRPDSRPSPRGRAAAVGIASFTLLSAVYALWLLALYPGILTADSLNQWEQAQTFRFDNWHPYLYALIMAGLKHLWYSPSTMAVLQLVLTAFVVAAVTRFAFVRGVPLPVLALFAGAYALHPQIGLYSVTIWKDVLFGIIIIAEAALLFLLVDRGGRAAWWPYLALGFLSGACVLIRFNGVLELVLPPLLLLAFRLDAKRVAVTFLVGLLTYGFFGVVLFRALHVGSPAIEIDQLKVKEVAAIYSSDRPNLTDGQRAVFESMWPAATWRSEYSPLSSDGLFFGRFRYLKPIGNPHGARGVADPAFYERWNRAVAGAIVRNPSAVLLDKWRQARAMLTLADVAPAAAGRAPTNWVVEAGRYPRLDTVMPASRYPALQRLVMRYLAWSGRGVQRRLLWTMLVPLAAYAAILAVAIARRLRATIAFVSFVLVNAAFTVAVSPASDRRYLYFCALAVFAAGLLAYVDLLARQREASEPAVPHEQAAA